MTALPDVPPCPAGMSSFLHAVRQGVLNSLADIGQVAAHIHAESDITNLEADLAGKAALVHTHAQSDITGLVSALAGKAATSHTHAVSDITSFGAGVGAVLAAGTNITLSTVSGVTTITAAGGGGGSYTFVAGTDLAVSVVGSTVTYSFTGSGGGSSYTFAAGTGMSVSVVGSTVTYTNTATGGLSPPAVMTMTAKNDYQFGSLDPLGTGEPANSFFNLGATAANNTSNEYTLAAQMYAVQSNSGVTRHKAAILGQTLAGVSNSTAQWAAFQIQGGVGVYGSCFVNGITGGSYGSGWGGCFETSVVSGSDGFACGIEAGVYLANTGQENSDPDDIKSIKISLWCGSGLNNGRGTAVLMNVHAAGANSGYFYGSILHDISYAYEYWRRPKSGAIGIIMANTTDWGDTLRATRISRLSRWDSAVTAGKNIISWDDTTSAIAIGASGDTIAVQTTAGQRVLEVDATNSAGSGYRTVRVAN